jgi:hypothetical protein
MKNTKIIFFLTIILFFNFSFAQIAPFLDFNNYFRTFHKNSFRQLEFQRVNSFEATDNIIVYNDFRGDFRVFENDKVQTLTNQNVSYKVSDNQLAWNIGPTLFCLKNSQKVLLTTFANNYYTSDSLIVYEDTRFNSVHVKTENNIIQLYQVTGDLYMPTKIGDNTVVFKDNGDFYKFYWNEKIYDFAVYSRPIDFSCGMDVICFNDPIHQSFAVFDKGEILDIESMFAKKYKAIRDAVVYEDQQGNLWRYSNGEKEALSNFGVSSWEAVDDIIVWVENNTFNCYANGQKKIISYFVPIDYKLKNNTLVYRNNMGGANVYHNNKILEITNQQNSVYNIYGNVVLVELFNKAFIVYYEGKIYEP